MSRSAVVGLVLWAFLSGARAQSPAEALIDDSRSELRRMIERYDVDRATLRRSESVPGSPSRADRLRRFLRDWRSRLDAVAFDRLSREGRIDWLLFRNHLDFALHELERQEIRDEELAGLLPFRDVVVELAESRRRVRPLAGRTAAESLEAMRESLTKAREDLGANEVAPSPERARRASHRLGELRRSLSEWHGFRSGYDPMFSWWTRAPFARVAKELEDYETALTEIATGGDEDAIVGTPIGREALVRSLAHEMIAYSPEELIDIAEKEFAWCEAEARRAADDLGFDGDWKKTLEHVKGLHVEPGEQPALIRELALEAVAFIEERDLLTIPALCKETWRMRMMSPRRQKVTPYFTGGEVVTVSFPTDGMEHEDKLMSLRGNNVHFSRATVHHELIPGHHLQQFMTKRHRSHRRVFHTPFWLEGWALYWEMRLWDLDFAKSAENRVGMLFWRLHRCARIVFSLRFHLGDMTAAEAVEYLMKRVGHERNNAEAEVRRSVAGDYSPLYQAAYMLGGLQIRALRREMVEKGGMAERAFHDAVIRQNSIPIEMIRQSMSEAPLSRDFSPAWRFHDAR